MRSGNSPGRIFCTVKLFELLHSSGVRVRRRARRLCRFPYPLPADDAIERPREDDLLRCTKKRNSHSAVPFFYTVMRLFCDFGGEGDGGARCFLDLLGAPLHHPAAAAGEDLREGEVFFEIVCSHAARGHEADLREGGGERFDGFKPPEIARGEEFEVIVPQRERLDDLRRRDDAGEIGNALAPAHLGDLLGTARGDNELRPRRDGALALLLVDDGARARKELGEFFACEADGLLRAVGAEADLGDGQPPFDEGGKGGLGVFERL